MKKALLASLVIIILGGVGAYYFLNQEDTAEYVTAKVEKKNLIQTVSEVGMVKSPREIKLSFSRSGELATKTVEVGDAVDKNEVLAELDLQSLKIQKSEALSNLEIAQAELNKLLSGAKQETIEVSSAQVEQAKKNYLSAQENLEKVKQTVQEDIDQAKEKLNDLTSDDESDITTHEQSIKSAQTNLENTKETYQQSMNNKKDSALTIVDYKLAVANTALDNVNRVLTDKDIENVLSAKNSSYLIKAENSYEDSLESWSRAKQDLDNALNSNSRENVNLALQSCLDCLNKVAESLDYCYKVLENTVTSNAFTQAELDTFKSNINTQITSVNSALSSVQTSQQSLQDAYLAYNTNVSNAQDRLEQARVNLEDAIRTAENTLSATKINGEQQITSARSQVSEAKETWEVAKRQKEEVSSSARQEDISLYRARVKQARANLDLAQRRIDESVIKSPIKGKVVNMEYKAGEQVPAAAPVISVLSDEQLEIEVDISEADIAKVKKGDWAEVTLDAFGEEEKFAAQVYFIDPDKTVIQDVVYYEVKLRFLENKQRLAKIKPGMTANIDITTNKKSNVLVIPSRAVIEKIDNQGNTGKMVRLRQEKNQIKEVPVQIGMRGDGGLVEVVKGLKEGQKVVTFVKENE